ncbi:MAG TPA: peptigoglycan-binding protein LysM, partial [Pseudomonas sp.]|nr:peptigoglycan-binding protein LysM [Pseudomonas sp.]
MVRVRNLVLAIAAATALTSEMAYALGLGEVTLKSALNQPLVAEIELLDAKTLAPGEVVPVLASAEDFNRAGVDRQYFLTDLTFTPVLRPDGKSVIRVSSTKPVREPYLNFLIEVLWPSGRLLREYTLLLDPPLYSPEIAASVAPQLPVATPVSRPAAAPQVASRSTSSSSTTPASQGGEYKVTPNDTLWEIAERARLGGTVHQTMLAIQDINPDAFIGNNINRMKNGQVLRLPSAEQIGRRSQAEAIQEVAQQNASWRQAAGPGAPAARQLDATQRGSADAAPSRSEQGDNLRLVAPAAGKSTVGSDGGDGADAAALRDKLAVSEESLDSSRRENLDLKDRLNDLQGQLDKLQR